MAFMALAGGCGAPRTSTGGGGNGGGGAPEASTGGGDGGGDPAPGPCGGVTCKAEEYCLYPLGDCGKTVGTSGLNLGTCAPRPTSCEGNAAVLACACDGQVYASACEAAQAGLSVGDGEECAIPPEGTFACGSFFCHVGAEWCEVLIDPNNEPIGGTAQSDCEQIPASCAGALSCECLSAAAPAAVGGHCGGPPSCTQDEAGDFTLQCEGKSLGG
jgi:hypothetical protein